MADWMSLLRGGTEPSDIATSAMGQYDAGRAKAIALAEGERKLHEQQQYRSKVAELLKNGDVNGAAAQAALYGDDKAATNFTTIQKQQYDQRSAGAGALGEITRGLAALPYEQRKTALMSSKPALMAMGYRPEDIDAFDPTDENVAAVAGLGYSAHDRASDTTNAYDANTKRFESQTKRIEVEQPVVVGGSLVTRGGEELYRAPDYINAPMGNNVIEVPGTSSSGYVGGNVGGNPDQVWRNMIGVESGGRQFAANGQPLTSPKGAVGRAQVMPGTGPEAAAAAGLPWDEQRYRNDPQYNEAIGRGYYNKMLQRYGGDPAKAAAAYNAGPGRVDRAVARAGKTGGDWTQYVPSETQGYVSRVIGQRSTTRGTRVIQQGVDTVGQRQAGKLNKPPVNATNAFVQNNAQIKLIDRAIGHLDAHPNAVGPGTGALGSWVTNKRDPDGVTARAAIGNIGAIIVHDLSGAAVTVSEEPRLRPFVPQMTDTPEVARQKLVNLKQQIEIYQNEYRETYSTQNGYNAVGRSGGATRVPKSHVDALRSGRVTPEQFDQKYGAGASERVLGR
jgi:hypothetical protein